MYAGTDQGGVLKTTNGGQTWTPVNAGFASYYVGALAIDPLSPATLYAASGVSQGVQLYKSVNGGASWNSSNLGLTTFLTSLAINPTNPSRIYAGSLDGVFASSDSGGSWSRFSTGLTEPASLKVSRLAIGITGRTLHAATLGHGVYDLTVASYDFYTITPCRLVDTRETGGLALAAGETRAFQIAGHCEIPASAGAIAFNLAVTQPTGDGYLLPSGADPGQ